MKHDVSESFAERLEARSLTEPRQVVRPLYALARAGLQLADVDGTGRPCWCSIGSWTGEHSPACAAARDALGRLFLQAAEEQRVRDRMRAARAAELGS